MSIKTLLLCVPLTGCFWATTKSEGESLRKDVTSLQSRIDTKEKELDTQIKKLQGVLEEATRVLKRNSADIGADVDKLSNDVRAANGLASDIKRGIGDLSAAFDAYKKANDTRLDGLEQRLAQLESGKPSANSSPEDLWKLGSTAYQAGRYNEAIEIYRRLATSYPTHERADDSLYFRGQAHGKLLEWEKAIGVYQTLNQKFPDGDLTDDGLYFAAIAAQRLKLCSEGRAYLEAIKKKFPKSNVGKDAAALETTLKKDAKNKAKCSS
jgi:TolA-binding protein